MLEVQLDNMNPVTSMVTFIMTLTFMVTPWPLAWLVAMVRVMWRGSVVGVAIMAAVRCCVVGVDGCYGNILVADGHRCNRCTGCYGNTTHQSQKLVNCWCHLHFTVIERKWYYVVVYELFQHENRNTSALNTLKTLNFMGTKFNGLNMMGMFLDTWICGFQIKHNIS